MKRGHAAVDLERGVYSNRSAVSCEAGHEVPMRVTTYAHREYRSLLVLEILTEGLKPGQKCTVTLQSCGLAWKDAHDFANVTLQGSDTTTAVVKTMEEPPQWSSLPKAPSTAVGIAVQTLPATITLTAEKPEVAFLSVYRSSLEDGLDADSVGPAAASHLKIHAATPPKELMAAHTNAWSEVWKGGIEIEGL